MWRWKTKRKTTKEKKSSRFGFFALISVYLLSFFVILYAGYSFFSHQKGLVRPVPFIIDLSKFKKEEKNSLKETESLLKQHNISYESVANASGSAILVVLPEDSEVLLSSKKPLLAQITSLQLVLSRLTIEGKKFSRLDFRFDKPLIVLKN